jgi:CRP/FNR family cyclic AMP-dependent transcriptional regulator
MAAMPWTPDAIGAEIAELQAEGRDTEARVLETLAGVVLLDGVPLDVLRSLAFKAEKSVFPAGTEVVREGDADGVGLFVVVSGEGSVRVRGREVETVRAGDHFGAVATIDGGPRTASVRAVSELRCLVLTDATFHELVHDQPRVAWRLLVYLAGLVRRNALAR